MAEESEASHLDEHLDSEMDSHDQQIGADLGKLELTAFRNPTNPLGWASPGPTAVECPICMDHLAEGTIVYKLPCMHIFHA